MNNQLFWPVFSLSSLNSYLIIANICFAFQIMFSTDLSLCVSVLGQGFICLAYIAFQSSAQHFQCHFIHLTAFVCWPKELLLNVCSPWRVHTHWSMGFLSPHWSTLPIQSMTHCQASPLTSAQLSTSFFNYITRTRHNILLLVITAVSKHVQCFHSECASFHVQGGHQLLWPQHHSRNLCSALRILKPFLETLLSQSPILKL